MKKNGARKHYAVVRLSLQSRRTRPKYTFPPCTTSLSRLLQHVNTPRNNSCLAPPTECHDKTPPYHNNALPKVAAVETKHLSCRVPGRRIQTRWMATVVSSTSFYVVANQKRTGNALLRAGTQTIIQASIAPSNSTCTIPIISRRPSVVMLSKACTANSEGNVFRKNQEEAVQGTFRTA